MSIMLFGLPLLPLPFLLMPSSLPLLDMKRAVLHNKNDDDCVPGAAVGFESSGAVEKEIPNINGVAKYACVSLLLPPFSHSMNVKVLLLFCPLQCRVCLP